MARRVRLSGIEKFLNNNCFMVFLFLFILVVCYVLSIKNRKVKENLINGNERKRKIRKTIESMKQNYNNRIEKLESNINKGIRNTDRKQKQINKNVTKKIQGMFKKFSFK